jgi:hypothetical protein
MGNSMFCGTGLAQQHDVDYFAPCQILSRELDAGIVVLDYSDQVAEGLSKAQHHTGTR